MKLHPLRPRVFIVEDSATYRLMMTKVLRSVGYEVEVATDGKAGLAQVLAYPPQCLILDILLPGINGYTICRQIRAIDPSHSLPIIMVSSKSSTLDQNYALLQGADRYLTKPFAEEMLLQLVSEFVPTPLQPTAYNARGQTLAQDKRLQLGTLIPARSQEADMLRVSNPFSSSAAILDKQTRHLYAAVDGYRTIKDLAQTLQLDIEATAKLLKVLWQQQHIVLYDGEHHLLKEFPALEM